MKRCAGQIRSLETDQPSSRPPIDYRFYFLVLKTLTSQQYNYDLHFCFLLRNISSIDLEFSIPSLKIISLVNRYQQRMILFGLLNIDE